MGRAPRVLILANEPTLPVDHPDADSEHDILYTADIVGRVLRASGCEVKRLGVTDQAQILLRGIEQFHPDAVFNLYEGTASWGDAEAYICGILELLRVPYTGCPPKPLMLCRSKPLTKQLLMGSGLPTAPFFTVPSDTIPACPLDFPVIVKPGMEDASVGIDQCSVVQSQQELERRVDYLRRTYGPVVLAEQFVYGREFNVAVVELDGVAKTLPFSEILFVPPEGKPDLWPIVSFDAKWRPSTIDFQATPAVNPAAVDEPLHSEISMLALRAFELAGCRDYARIDFRVDRAGKPYILEVNPNPCISPLAGLAAGLESAQIPYPYFIADVARAALRRGGTPELAKQLAPPDKWEGLPADPVPAV